MDLTLRIVLLVVSVFFLAFVLFRIRKGKYLLKYSFIWILLSGLGLISAVFPVWIYGISYALGFNIPSNFVYFVLITILLISNLILCGILSKHETEMKNIIQEFSVLKSRIDKELDE